MILPHLTTASREREDMADKTLCAMKKLIEGEKDVDEIFVKSHLMISHSCGCMELDYRTEAEKIDDAYAEVRQMNYRLLNSEVALVRLNKVDCLEQLETVFRERAINIGGYSSFFLMLNEDTEGKLTNNSEFGEPSGCFAPVVWIDRDNIYIRPEKSLEKGELIPRTTSDTSHSYILSSIHTPENVYGYAAIEMNDDGRSKEFYRLWLIMLGMTLETLRKNYRINKLIGSLESKSLSDEMTGLLNRRGFYSAAKKEMQKRSGLK